MKTPASADPENECPPPGEAEIRATAWALGQLEDLERAAFEQKMASDPALAAYAQEMRAFCAEISLELPTEADESLFTLAETQRAPVVAALSEAAAKVVQVSFVRRHWRGLALVSTAAAAACITVMRPVWLPEGRMSTATGRQSGPGNNPPSTSAKPDLSLDQMAAVKPPAGPQSADFAAADGVTLPAASTGGSEAPEALLPPPATAPAQPGGALAWTSQPGAIRTYGESEATSGRQLYDSYAVREDKNAAAEGKRRGRAPEATPLAALSTQAGNPANNSWSYPAASAPVPGSANTEGFYYKSTSLSSLEDRPARPGLRTSETDALSAAYPAHRFQEPPSAESYQRLAANPFFDVAQAPLSTFSTDVDTASYANVRRFLNAGSRPPAEAVRLEELVNYFPYDEPGPVDGKPFAVRVDVTSAPWDAKHRLARVILKGKEIAAAERPASNLVFLVDVSGSMNEPNKLPLVQQSLLLLADRLTENDRVSLVTYAGNSQLVLPSTNGQNQARIRAAIDSLSSGGGTNGAGGLVMAYQQAAANFIQGGVNRVILATDGDFNVGITSHEDLLSLITAKAKSGVFLSVLGYGMGNLKDDTMELLADKGNGNYAYIDSLGEARKSLVEQMSGTLVTIAKDVKIQIEFNPAVVKSYKLLGYENRMLAKEDFNNDKKDAGEIGAGHTVTALYEIIPVGQPEVPVKTAVDGLKYQQTPAVITPKPEPTPTATASGEMMNVKLRWKQPQADTSDLMEVPVKDSGTSIEQASSETRWAAAIAGFARLLRGDAISPDAADGDGLTWESIRQLARGAKGPDPLGYRGEFLQLLDKAESLSR